MKELKNKEEDVHQKKILEIIDRLKKNIKRFKKYDYSAEEIRNFINICYINYEFRNAQLREFSTVEEEDKIKSNILHEVNLEINKIFYEKYNTDDYFAPIIDKIHVDTLYKSKQIGNVIETKFEDYRKLDGKNIESDYSYEGESCNLHQEFTEDGRLITTCKKGGKKGRAN